MITSCPYCDDIGHVLADCPEWQRDELYRLSREAKERAAAYMPPAPENQHQTVPGRVLFTLTTRN